MNSFESGQRKQIPAVLIYAKNGSDVLMIQRHDVGKRPDGRADYHAGKWNGLGGKCEPGESPFEAAEREFLEEAGVRISRERFQSLGVLTFPNFKPKKNEDWVVFLFVLEISSSERSEVKRECPEGVLHWIPEKNLLELNLWEGDRKFLPSVITRTPIIGTVWYEDGVFSRHEIVTIKN